MAREKRADVLLRAQTRKYKQDLKEAKKHTRQFAADIKKSLIGGFRGGFGSVAGLATAAGLADVGQEVFAFEEQLIRIDIQAEGAADLDAIRAKAKGLRDDFGLARIATAEVGAELTNLLGGAAADAEKIGVLGTRMVGTGVAARDLAGLAQILDQQFGLGGADDLARGLDQMIAIGKKGSVPLRDMAKVGKQTASVFRRIGADGTKGVGQLAAALQLGEQAFGTPAEAGTGLRAMVEGLQKATIKSAGLRKQLGQVGTESFADLEVSLERLATSEFFTDKEKFLKAFPSAPARTMITALVEGRAAFDKFTESGQRGEEQVVGLKDAQKFARSEVGQLKIAMAGLRGEAEKLFTPERTQAMIKAVKLLSQALGFVIDNWELFLGAFLAAKSAQIGFAIFKWAKASKELAGGLGLAQRLLQKLGTTPTPAGLMPAGAAPGVASTALQKAAGGAIAFGTGFGVGQLIGEEIVRKKQKRFATKQTQQKKALKERDVAFEAAQRLIEGGGVSTEGVIDPQLLRSLRVAKITGRELTPLQQAAETSLAGFEVPKAITSAGGFVDALTDAAESRRGPERKRFVETDESLIEAFRNIQEANLQAIRELANRPIEVKIGADTVATAVQEAPRNNRSPAP